MLFNRNTRIGEATSSIVQCTMECRPMMFEIVAIHEEPWALPSLAHRDARSDVDHALVPLFQDVINAHERVGE